MVEFRNRVRIRGMLMVRWLLIVRIELTIINT